MSRTVRRLLPLLLCLFAWASGAQAQECASMGGTCSIPQNGQSSTCSTNELESGTCVVQGQQGVCCLPKVCEERSGSSACYAGVTCPAGTVSMGDGGCTTGSCCATIATPTPTPTPTPGPTPPPGGGRGGGTYRLEFVHTDMLGSVRMVTDATGAVVSRHDYKPFGEEVGVDEGGRSDIGGYAHPDEDPRARERFTGKPRDAGGLDYFGARYYSSAQGRFTSADPSEKLAPAVADPQMWNRYAYVSNRPLAYVDPDGRDAIAIVYKDYKIATPAGRVPYLGHAGIVTIDSSGRTRYREYGRYDKAARGLVRGQKVPDLKMGANGVPTKDSLTRLMSVLSASAGQGGSVSGAYYRTDDKATAAMNKYTDDRQAQNTDPNREPYGLFSNNCGTFCKQTLDSGGVDTPMMIDPRPNSYIYELQAGASLSLEYAAADGKKKAELVVKCNDGKACPR